MQVLTTARPHSPQVQTQQILREKSELQAQVEAMSSGSSDETEALRAQVEQLQAELQAAYDREAAAPPPEQPGTGHDTLLRELHDAQDAAAQLQASLDQAQAELDSRLERSTQFVNLKQARCDTTAAAPPSRRYRANAARLSHGSLLPSRASSRQMLRKKSDVVRHLRETLEQHGIRVDDVDALDD